MELCAKLHSTMSADVWAKEFMNIWGDKLIELDLDLMRGWFANSIMCGYDHGIEKVIMKDDENE